MGKSKGICFSCIYYSKILLPAKDRAHRADRAPAKFCTFVQLLGEGGAGMKTFSELTPDEVELVLLALGTGAYSQAQIAARLGTSREVVSRIVRKAQREGALTEERMVGVGDTGSLVGQDHPRATLTDDEVELIRQLAEGPDRLSFRQIAEKFGVSKGTVGDIVSYRRRATAAVGWRKARVVIRGVEEVPVGVDTRGNVVWRSMGVPLRKGEE